MRRILIGSSKGGAGKSTLALNLAIALNAIGQRVGIEDKDKQLSLADALSGRPSPFPSHRDPDLVVVDVAGHDSATFRTEMLRCDMLLMPVLPRSVDLWAVSRFANVVREALQHHKFLPCATLNMVDPAGNDHLVVEDELKELGFMVVGRVGRRKIFSDLFADGLGVAEHPLGHDTRAKAEILQLARNVVTVLNKYPNNA